MFRRILVIVIIIIIGRSIAFAGIGVDPIILEVVVSKDVPTKGVFRVSNTGANPVHIRVSPEKWQGMDRDIKTWLSLEPMVFELAQNEKKEVSYKISTPGDSSGEIRCIVFFVADEMGEHRSNVGIRFGVPIYAIVGGTEVLDVEISGIEIGYADNVLSGSILVNNKSNIHVRPRIDIDVLDSKDRLISSYNLPHGQPAQLGQNRPFEFEQYLVLNDGRYKAVVKVDYGQMYGLENRIARKKTSFVVRKGEKKK